MIARLRGWLRSYFRPQPGDPRYAWLRTAEKSQALEESIQDLEREMDKMERGMVEMAREITRLEQIFAHRTP